MAASSFLQLALSIMALQSLLLVQARPPNIMTSSPLITYVSSPASYTHTAFTIYSTPLYPPSPHPHHHHHHQHTQRKQLHSQRAVVTGHVFCDICKDGQIKEPLRGVTIGVTCWNGKEEQFFHGTTNKSGQFKVKLSGYNPRKHGGGKSCHAKLIYPAFKTSCMLPTNLHDGMLGAPLRVMSESPQKLVLYAGPFAYTTRSTKNKKCHKKDGNLMHSHKHKTSSSHSYKHPRQHENQHGPSCPIDDCKQNIIPSAYKHE